MGTLARWHGASSELGAAIAAACVAATACIYTAEVVGRYFLDAPLNWSGDVSSYLLCAGTFLALPKVTQARGHVAIGYFLEQISPSARGRYARAIELMAGLVCLSTAAYIGIEGVRLFEEGVLTTQATQMPKWLIALLACLGLGSSALHLLVSPPPLPPPQAGEGREAAEEAAI
jgi:TRAP-type C4-dicarboxylate transport system permease small subunit